VILIFASTTSQKSFDSMKIYFTGLLVVLSGMLAAQNTYSTISVINESEGWLRSPAAASATSGMRLLIYQHGGAAINLTGDNTGHVGNINGAGFYDLNQVVRVGGDTIYLALPVKHDYDLSATQLVVADSPEEQTISEAISAQPYDGTTGGVLFLVANSRLTVSAVISAIGTGFRGGIGGEAASDCNRFTVANAETYALGNWRGSARGEGVAGVPAGQQAGRSPAANGGGGGNDHNAGGGGGGNIAAGGLGARNIVMGLFNNACRGNFPGRGGRGMDATDQQLFLGGGGGAGHANNTTSASGGAGGGLVILWSPTIEFTSGGSLDASGQSPAEVDGDGGGGGGAGGSALLLADSLIGSPVVNLSGGKGADVLNASDRCFGPGGGGGGGRLLIAAFERQGWTPETDFARGGPGLRLNSNECGEGEEPAGGGNGGSQQIILFPIPFGGFVQSADTLCANERLQLTDASQGAQQASWEVFPQSDALDINPIGLSLRVNFDDTTSGTFIAVQTLILNGEAYPGDTATFTVFPVAAADGGSIVFDDEFVTATVTNPASFSTIRYDFGDGTVIDTNVTSLMYTYIVGGDYDVTITLINDRCGDLEVSNSSVSLAEFGFADTDAKTEEGCAPFSPNVNDISTGVYAGSRWNFPGAEPEVLFDVITPQVVYSLPGTYEASFTLLGTLGPDTVETFTVIVNPVPSADFTFSIDTATAVFAGGTDIGDTFSWDFGDSTGVSSDLNPTYSYDSAGTFTVTFTASLGACSTTVEQDVTIEILSDLAELQRLGIKLYPNPTSGALNLTGNASLLDIFDIRGRYLGPLNGQMADLNELPTGTYIVRLKAGEKVYSLRVLKR
jgi:PKD repeat protein